MCDLIYVVVDGQGVVVDHGAELKEDLTVDGKHSKVVGVDVGDSINIRSAYPFRPVGLTRRIFSTSSPRRELSRADVLVNLKLWAGTLALTFFEIWLLAAERAR